MGGEGNLVPVCAQLPLVHLDMAQWERQSDAMLLCEYSNIKGKKVTSCSSALSCRLHLWCEGGGFNTVGGLSLSAAVLPTCAAQVGGESDLVPVCALLPLVHLEWVVGSNGLDAVECRLLRLP